MKNKNGRKIPNKTVQIFPFSKVIVATANSTTSVTVRSSRAWPLPELCLATSETPTGVTPSSSRAVTPVAMNTASIDTRPALVQ
jgi:hypothetical protein